MSLGVACFKEVVNGSIVSRTRRPETADGPVVSCAHRTLAHERPPRAELPSSLVVHFRLDTHRAVHVR